MRMIAGFIAPSSGRGRRVRSRYRTRVGRRQILHGLLAGRGPELRRNDRRRVSRFRRRHPRPLRRLRKQRRDVVIDRLALVPVIDQVVETLSKGFRRRVGLAQALIHDPQVLILDEPTDGLDPNQKHEVRRLINELSKDKLVIVSTHILEEVHEVCTRAIIIANGRIVADETPSALEARSRYHHAVSLRFESREQLAAAAREIGALPEVAAVEANERDLRLTAVPRPGANALPAVSALIASNNWDVPELHLESGRLDEVFRSLTEPPHGHAKAPVRPAPKERRLEQGMVSFPTRTAQLFRDSVGLCVHRDLSGARRGVHLSGRRTVRARPGGSAIRSSAGIRGCTWSSFRPSPCACGPRSATAAASSC
jgi:ABC-2 type transport system ATP-binding protein